MRTEPEWAELAGRSLGYGRFPGLARFVEMAWFVLDTADFVLDIADFVLDMARIFLDTPWFGAKWPRFGGSKDRPFWWLGSGEPEI